MAIISSTEAKQRFGLLLNTAQREPVHIQSHDRDVAVVISPLDFNEYRQLQLKQVLQNRSAQNPGNTGKKSERDFAASKPAKPRATIDEFREFLKFMSSQPTNASDLREETFGREFLYGDHN
jgi:prevent-host-death family protein